MQQPADSRRAAAPLSSDHPATPAEHGEHGELPATPATCAYNKGGSAFGPQTKVHLLPFYMADMALFAARMYIRPCCRLTSPRSGLPAAGPGVRRKNDPVHKARPRPASASAATKGQINGGLITEIGGEGGDGPFLALQIKAHNRRGGRSFDGLVRAPASPPIKGGRCKGTGRGRAGSGRVGQGRR